MAKLKILRGVLGELLKDKMMPDVDVGALGNIANENTRKTSNMFRVDGDSMTKVSPEEEARIKMRIDNMPEEARELNSKKARNEFFGLGDIFTKMEDLGIEFVEKPMKKNFDMPMTNKEISDKMDLLEDLPQIKNLSEADKFEASGIFSTLNPKPPSVTFDYEIPEIEKALGYEFPAIDIDDVLTDPTALLSDVKKDSPAFYLKGKPFIITDERNNKAFFADFGMGQSYIRNWAPIRMSEVDTKKAPNVEKGSVVQFEEKSMLGAEQPLKAKGIGNIDFQLFDENPDVEKFANKAMNDELINAINTGSFDNAKEYMGKIQDKYEDLGAQDSEPSAIINSILENHFFGE